MDAKEAIGRIETHNRIHAAKEFPFAIKITEALDMAVKALEKQVPMEHHHTIVGECSGGEKIRTSICPSCLGCILTVEEEFPRFCAWCGQAIDWKNKTDNNCRCDTCLSKNLIGIVPPHCEWYRDNVTFGSKSSDECPYYKSIKNNT